MFWLYGNRVINLQSGALHKLLYDYPTGMICVVRAPNFPPLFRVVSILSGTLDQSRIIGIIALLIITVVMP